MHSLMSTVDHWFRTGAVWTCHPVGAFLSRSMCHQGEIPGFQEQVFWAWSVKTWQSAMALLLDLSWFDLWHVCAIIKSWSSILTVLFLIIIIILFYCYFYFSVAINCQVQSTCIHQSPSRIKSRRRPKGHLKGSAKSTVARRVVGRVFALPGGRQLAIAWIDASAAKGATALACRNLDQWWCDKHENWYKQQYHTHTRMYIYIYISHKKYILSNIYYLI